MKTSLIILFSLICQSLCAQSGRTIWTLFNELTHWDTNGVMVDSSKQRVTAATNLIQTDLYVFPNSTTITQQLWVLNGWLGSLWHCVGRTYMAWSTDGTVVSNFLSPDGTWEPMALHNGGSQGAKIWTNSEGRYRMILFANFLAYWKTNDFSSWCSRQDDAAGMIWWFRDKPVSAGLPWFVGARERLEPGDYKIVSVETPMDTFWAAMGVDTHRGCGTNVFLTSWPMPVSMASNSRMTHGSSGIELGLSGTPGQSYRIEGSVSIGEWNELHSFQMPESGQTNFQIQPDKPIQFFRMTRQ
jgi:hypothetical protein